jgi:cytochrome c biogenesis protein CcdA/thiol-disulfide isomerase/thioredoxin
MLIVFLAYLGGVLTILSPCILPVIPFVFTRAGEPFARSGLPLLAGMALAFTLVASLGAVAGGWAVTLNEYARWAAMAVLALAGAMLLMPSLSAWLMRPAVALGARLSSSAAGRSGTPRGALLLGVATGLLWAPCAGPVLGLILSAAIMDGPTPRTFFLLLSYALGAATSLALALLLGGRLLAPIKRSLRAGEWLRRGLGAAVLAGVAAIALGLDTGALARLSQAGGSIALEQKLLPARLQKMQAALALPVEGSMPPLAGAVAWLNSPPLTREQLRGKVVLVDIWTYGCYNCRNALPYVREWHRKYKDQGLVVVGVHSPEFAYEKNIDNVKRAVDELQVSFPVAIDNDHAIWRAFNNRYWPAHYFIDAQGRIRFHHFGEGEYEKSEQVIRQLLQEARQGAKPV